LGCSNITAVYIEGFHIRKRVTVAMDYGRYSPLPPPLSMIYLLDQYIEPGMVQLPGEL
jgi:hypothetical protein